MQHFCLVSGWVSGLMKSLTCRKLLANLSHQKSQRHSMRSINPVCWRISREALQITFPIRCRNVTKKICSWRQTYLFQQLLKLNSRLLHSTSIGTVYYIYLTRRAKVTQSSFVSIGIIPEHWWTRSSFSNMALSILGLSGILKNIRFIYSNHYLQHPICSSQCLPSQVTWCWNPEWEWYVQHPHRSVAW